MDQRREIWIQHWRWSPVHAYESSSVMHEAKRDLVHHNICLKHLTLSTDQADGNVISFVFVHKAKCCKLFRTDDGAR